MKKILLSILILFVLVGANNSTQAQCTILITNNVVTPVGPPTQDADTCEFVFNASFDITANDGFKALFFHTFLADQYPSPAVFVCSGSSPATAPPTATQLGTYLAQAGMSILDIGFYGLNDSTLAVGVEKDVTNAIANIYFTDPSVALTNTFNSPGLTAKVTKLSATTLHFEVTNITVKVAGLCGAVPLVVKTDVWGANSGSLGSVKAQCYVCGQAQSFNDPFVTLIKFCGASPFKYDIGMETDRTTPIHVVYRLRAHDPLLGVDKDPTDPIIFTSDTIVLVAGTPFDPAPIDLPAPYCCIAPWSNWGIYAEVVGRPSEFTNALGTNIDYGNSCATLPIKLRSFDANRNKSNVDLKWVTEIEENNKGFYVERMLSNGGWQQVTFVASQATNGNSNSPLTYVLSDFNNTKGISQYRLRQIDIDGKQAFSQIRSVRGEGQKSNTIIYPNPSGDGKVNIVFEGVNSIRDVSLMDVSGKTLKQWKGVTNNNIRIDNLNAGFYTVRIVNVETGEQVVEKFIVNKR